MAKKAPKPQTGGGIDPETRAEYLRLERERTQLQRRAVASQNKELGLLRKQTNAQTAAYNQQLGVLQSQVALSQNTATQYQTQLDSQKALQDQQTKLAEDEARRAGMEQTIQSGNVAATQLRGLRTLNQRSKIQRGFISA